MDKKFVSRAGQKLDHALDVFLVEVKGKVCADLGCSTGGFTDCLLQRGASKVYAIDTAYGELDWNLRNDDRVVVMERTNALNVELPELVDIVVIDVGWTKQEKIIPKALEMLKDKGDIVSLLKPQYEAERNQLKKGVVIEEELPLIVEKAKRDLESTGVTIKDITESPIKGDKGGNTEYLMWIKK